MKESQSERTQRILKTIMFVTNYDKVNEFSDAIGANYMQVYYCVTGRTKGVNMDLAEKILKKFPDLNPEFIRKGVGVPLKNDSSNGNNVPTEFIPYEKYNNDDLPQIATSDVVTLLNRVTSLLEKVQQKWDEVQNHELVLENRLKRIDALETRLIELLDAKKM